MPETAAEFSRAETAFAASSTLMELRQAVLRYATDAGRRPSPSMAGNSTREAEELPGAGAAETVDRLVGIAHRGQRVPAAEDRGEQHHLRVRGVLELVQQHHLELGAFPLRGLRDLLGDAGCQCHEVAVVQGAARGLRLRVAPRPARRWWSGCAACPAACAPPARARPACPPGTAGPPAWPPGSSTQALASVGGMRCSAHSPAKVTTASISVFLDEARCS